MSKKFGHDILFEVPLVDDHPTADLVCVGPDHLYEVSSVRLSPVDGVLLTGQGDRPDLSEPGGDGEGPVWREEGLSSVPQ